MPTSPIVEDFGFGQLSGFIDAFTNTLLFQAAEEGSGSCIAPAVAAPTHHYDPIFMSMIIDKAVLYSDPSRSTALLF